MSEKEFNDEYDTLVQLYYPDFLFLASEIGIHFVPLMPVALEISGKICERMEKCNTEENRILVGCTLSRVHNHIKYPSLNSKCCTSTLSNFQNITPYSNYVKVI